MDKNTKAKVPAIRFKGFEGGWQEQQIGQVLEEKQRPIVLNDNQKYELITVKRRNAGVVSRGYLLGKEILVKNYYQLKENDFVVSKRQVVHGATGIIPKNLNDAIVSNEYLVVEDNEKLSTGFLNLLSCLPKMKNDFFLSSYGVDVEKLFFDFEDWKKRLATVPDKAEQIKLAVFFKQLDVNLELHEARLDKLNDLKQAMLQKMFPQGDATVPEIRFKGFEGDWEQHEFKLIASRNAQLTAKQHLPSVEYEDIVSGAGRLNKDVFKKKSEKTGIIFDKGDVLFGKLRPYLKNWWLAEFKGVAVGDFWVFKSSVATSGFIYYLIQTEDYERVANQSAGSKMPRSDWKLVSNSLFRVPVFTEEQQKVYSYFRKLDYLITLKCIAIDRLKQIKQSCLTCMFV